MNKLFTPIKKILGRKNYFLIFIISGLIYGIIFALMTNLIDIRYGLSYIRFPFTWQRLSLFLILSILGGLLISLQIFSFQEKQKNYISTTTGVSGILFSFFATACPFCKPLLLSLIGFSGSIAILKYGNAFALLSVFLLFGSIYLTLLSITKKNCCGN